MPAEIPVTMPEAEPTVAMPVLLLLQVPPGTGSVKTIVPVWHTWQPVDGQAMGPGVGVIVTTTVAVQPVDMV